MYIEIITPDRNIFSGEIESGIFPGSDGFFGVQENHAPMVATLKEGKVKLFTGNQEEIFDVKGGVLEISHNKVILLAD